MPSDIQRRWVVETLGVDGVKPSNLSPAAPKSDGKDEIVTRNPEVLNDDDTATNPVAVTTSKPATGVKLPGAGDVSPKVSGAGKDSPPVDGKPPAALTATVGRGGKNKPDDVKWVQAALNEKAGAGLVVDGKCGGQTLDAIKKFQSSLGMRKPDQLIEPGKLTALALAGAKGGAAKPASTTPEGAQAGDKKGKPASGPSPEAGVALQAAQEILDEHPKAKESCEGWMGKLTDTMTEPNERMELAEGKVLALKMKRTLSDYLKVIEEVEKAVARVKNDPTPAACASLTKKCAKARPWFRVLSDLTDEALQWWGINSTPEWDKKKTAAKSVAADSSKQEIMSAIQAKQAAGKKTGAESDQAKKDMIKRKIGIGGQSVAENSPETAPAKYRTSTGEGDGDTGE